MTTFLQDCRHTFRLLAGHPGFAVAALLTIALGVGGTAAVFSVVYGVLLRPLPYAEPERLVRMWEEHPGAVAPISGQPQRTVVSRMVAAAVAVAQLRGDRRVQRPATTRSA